MCTPEVALIATGASLFGAATTAFSPSAPAADIPQLDTADTETGGSQREKARLIQKQIKGGPGPGRKATVSRNRDLPTNITRNPRGPTPTAGPTGF